MARILILTPQLPYPPHQGTTIRNFNLIAGLARRHTIDLLTFSAPGQEAVPADDSPLRAYCRRIGVHAAPARALRRRALDTLTNPLPDMALRLSSPAMYASLTEFLNMADYDIVQVEGIEMAPYGLAAAEARSRSSKGRPWLLFDDHNAEYVLQLRAFLTDARQPRRWLAAAYSMVQWHKLRAYERRICLAVDRVVSVSEGDCLALRRLVPGLDVAVVPNGVDLDFYRPGATEAIQDVGDCALVFTGKMDYRPNVDAVVWFADQVLPLIQARRPEARFYIVGQQPHPRVAALSARPGVVVTGRVPDVRPFIAASAVYVVPLRIGGGTRLKVLEAMAMGQAIVSTRLGCDGFPFEDGREVRLADSPAAFAESVLAVAGDRYAAAQLGRRAREYVSVHYGWDSIVPLLERLYP